MSETKVNSFIEDLHNATVWTTYYDTIIEALWGLIVFKRYNYYLSKIVEIYEKYV